MHNICIDEDIETLRMCLLGKLATRWILINSMFENLQSDKSIKYVN